MQTKLQLLALVVALSAGGGELTTTASKRAFVNDFLNVATTTAAQNNPHAAGSANKNRYFTLLMDCWPLYQVKHLMQSPPAKFFRRLTMAHAADERRSVEVDKFNNYEIIDCDCPQSWDVLATPIWDNAVPENRRAGFFKQILILCDECDFERLEEVLERRNGRIRVSIMSRVIIARARGERYELYQIYRISDDRPLVYENYGNWSFNEGLKLTYFKAELSTRRRNLEGLFFVISFTLDHPETKYYYNTIKYPENDAVIKQSYGYFENIVDMVNMTYNNLYHNTYGSYNATTKTWNGQTEALRTGASNYSGSPMVIIKPRLPFIDYIVQVSQRIKLKFVLKTPPTSYVRDIFSIAFHGYVWWALFGMLILFSAVIGYLLRMERKLFGNVAGNANDGILVTFESISQQGSVVPCTSISGEILIFVLSLACMFLYTAYSTNIVSLLQSTTNIKDLQDLLDSPFEVGAEDTIYIRYFMKTETDPIRKALYLRKVGENGFIKLEDGLEKVRRGGYAFHVNKNPGYYYILRHFDTTEMCSLQRIEAIYLPTHLIYIPMPKDSPYKKIKKVGVFRILETGLHLRQALRFENEPLCTGISPSFKTIEIIDVNSPFWILLIGGLVALFVFIIELGHHHRRKLRPRRLKISHLLPPPQ